MNRFRYIFLATVSAALLALSVTGCSDSRKTSVTESASEDEVAAYKQLVAEQEAAAEAEEGNDD